MTRRELTMMALEAAAEVTGLPITDQHTQDIGFYLFCAVMAEEAADRGLTAEDVRAGGVL